MVKSVALFLIVNFAIYICGEDIDITKAPYQVSIQQNADGSIQQICSGCLIDNDLVLTATNCFYGAYASVKAYSVKVGSAIWNGTDGQSLEVAQIITHDDFIDGDLENDIALIRLSKNVTLSDSVKTIEMASEESLSETEAFVSGWGKIEVKGETHEHLQGVNVTLISLEECNKKVRDKISPDHFCATAKTCKPESGSPLVVNGKLIGIVSWGDGCRKLRPLVSTNVTDPLISKWISENTNVIRNEN